MDIVVHRPVTVHVDAIRVIVPIRYDDDRDEMRAAGLLQPGETTLTLTLDLETKKVRGWNLGAQSSHTKVADQGTYELIADAQVVARISEAYVPGVLPGDHYGDYVILSIAADGTVANWEPTTRQLEESFDEEHNVEWFGP